MFEDRYEHNDGRSYLSGDQWVLTVHTDQLILSTSERQITQHSKIEIAASYNSIKSWNQQFWSLFPNDEEALLEYAHKNRIVISIGFPFCPTVSLKQQYGKFSLAKIGRIASHWRSSQNKPPTEFLEVIAEYEHDKSEYYKQYNLAWQELDQFRLPAHHRHFIGIIIPVAS